jgi:YHS domain-containing protein
MSRQVSDPVCGKDLEATQRELSEEYAGETYFFCSSGCLERFIQDTDLFTNGAAMGEQVTRDRGQRAAVEGRGYSGPITFEQSQT